MHPPIHIPEQQVKHRVAAHKNPITTITFYNDNLMSIRTASGHTVTFNLTDFLSTLAPLYTVTPRKLP
jgi:hypothetical protein